MNRRDFLKDSAAVAAGAAISGASAYVSAAALGSLDSKGAREMSLKRLTRDNAVLLLVDHQVGLYTGIRDIDLLHLKHNIVGLTRAMQALRVPVIVTTTSENMWGPMIPELAEVLKGVKTIERTTVNAWDEKRVVDAIKATGRKSLIVTGVSTDVCLAFPAIAALADGYDTYAVVDASGGFTQTQVDMGILRMQQAGVVPVSYSNVAIEILADNAAPEAQAVYGALSMPFSGLVFGLRQYWSRA
jgi:nicotinamidase-related amidase